MGDIFLCWMASTSGKHRSKNFFLHLTISLSVQNTERIPSLFPYRVIVFNTTFNNISAISWWSVLLVEETGVHRENHWPAASHWQTLSHNVVSSTPPWTDKYTIHFTDKFQTWIFEEEWYSTWSSRWDNKNIKIIRI
jgi:hypothetical protein